MSKYSETLTFILNSLVTKPTSVSMETSQDGDDTVVYVKVAPEDMGVVIGRNGIMANAIKTLISSIAKANGESVKVRFLEPDGTFKYTSNTQAATISLDDDTEEFIR